MENCVIVDKTKITGYVDNEVIIVIEKINNEISITKSSSLPTNYNLASRYLNVQSKAIGSIGEIK